jgi:hypothetical protein
MAGGWARQISGQYKAGGSSEHRAGAELRAGQGRAEGRAELGRAEGRAGLCWARYG